MQKFKVDKKTLIRSAFYVVLVLEIIFFLPLQVKYLFNLRSKVKDLRTKVTQCREDINCQSKFTDQQERIKIETLNLETKIITTQDIFTVSAYIADKAKENSVEILQLLPQKPEAFKTIPEGKFSYLPLKIEAKGGFHNIAKFLNVVSRGYYFLETRELKIREDKPYHSVSFILVALLKE